MSSKEVFQTVPPAEPPHQTDILKAEEEEQQLQRARNKHLIDQSIKGIIGWGMRAVIVIVFVILCGSIFALGYHMLMPAQYAWLEEHEINDVKDFLLSGAIVGLGTSYLRKFF